MRRYRFNRLETIALQIDQFRFANRGDTQKHRAATSALSFLEMAFLAYGDAERRAYLIKAQNAFRLSFL